MNDSYANPEVLVSTDWLESNLNNTEIRIVESNEDQLLYRAGHIPGAVEIDWVRDLNDPLRRDYLKKAEFEELMSKNGITKNTCVVFYGDKSNWWACYAFWIFQLFGHTNAKILNGGSLKWKRESRPTTKNIPAFEASNYTAPVRDDAIERAFRDQVFKHVDSGLSLIDVRSPEEYSGEKLHMEGYPQEGALRGGHIPGAKSIPWSKAANLDDGTFKTLSELQELYSDFKKEDNIIAYCRIGERSSHTWFVLKYLLGFQNIRNYDGSWTEWGNLVNAPIEK